jgi:hypothetical protein
MPALIFAAAVHSAVARLRVHCSLIELTTFFAGLLFIFSCLIKMGGGTPKQHPAADEKGEETRKMIGLNTNHHAGSSQEEQDGYDMVPNPDADVVDLSELRGTRAPGAAADRHGVYC